MKKSMIEREIIAQNLLMDGLFYMNLPKENIIAVVTMLKTESKMLELFNWIKHHHMENPHKLIVMLVAIRLKDGINADLTDSLIKGVSLISDSLDLMTKVVMTMKSEKQMQTMIDYIYKHQTEIASEDELISVTQEISEHVS